MNSQLQPTGQIVERFKDMQSSLIYICDRIDHRYNRMSLAYAIFKVFASQRPLVEIGELKS